MTTSVSSLPDAFGSRASRPGTSAASAEDSGAGLEWEPDATTDARCEALVAPVAHSVHTQMSGAIFFTMSALEWALERPKRARAAVERVKVAVANGYRLVVVASVAAASTADRRRERVQTFADIRKRVTGAWRLPVVELLLVSTTDDTKTDAAAVSSQTHCAPFLPFLKVSRRLNLDLARSVLIKHRADRHTIGPVAATWSIDDLATTHDDFTRVHA